MFSRKAFLAALLAAAVPAFTPAAAQPVRSVDQRPALHTLDLGNGIELTALSDGTVPQDLHELLIGLPKPEVDALLSGRYLENPVEASINAFLIRIGDRLVLVDTGAGEVFGRGLGGELPSTLRSIGIPPEMVTDILITHVHSDHSGGLTVGGKPVFPNAVVHLAKADLEFFLDPRNAQRTGYDARYFAEAATTLGPYLKSGKIRTFEAPAELLPGLTAEAVPGHTPGSTIYRLRAGETEVAFIGDLVHVEAVQFPKTDVAIVYDVSKEQAVAARERAFERLARERVLVAAPHLSFPGLGHIRPAGDGYEWVRIDFVDRAPQ